MSIQSKFLESLSQLLLCSVAVIPSKFEPRVWPSPVLLVTVTSDSNQNCRDACMTKQLASNICLIT